MAQIISSLKRGGRAFKRGGRALFDPLARALVRLGVSPDAVTLAGTAGMVVAAITLAGTGRLIIGTFVITALALFDVVDGAMARIMGRSSRFGAVLDATMDRVSDGALFGAVAWWLATTGDRLLAAVTIVCLVGGQVVSYVKARAEAEGFTCNVGFAQRFERLAILGVGGLLSGLGVSWALGAVLWVLAVLSVWTAAHRVLHVRAQERAQERAQ